MVEEERRMKPQILEAMALRILELAVEVRAMVGEENYRGKAVEVREKEVAVVENYRDKVVEVKVMVEACK